jgi:hypothetical protein
VSTKQKATAESFVFFCQPVSCLQPKQVVLVSNLVLIAMQLGPYCKAKQVVLVD